MSTKTNVLLAGVAALVTGMGVTALASPGTGAPGAAHVAALPAPLPEMCNGKKSPNVLVRTYVAKNGTVPAFRLSVSTDASGTPTGKMTLGEGADALVVSDWCRIWQHDPGQTEGGNCGEPYPAGAVTAHAVGLTEADGQTLLVRADVRKLADGRMLFRVRYRPLTGGEATTTGATTTETTTTQTTPIETTTTQTTPTETTTTTQTTPTETTTTQTTPTGTGETEGDSCEDESWTRVPAEGWAPLDWFYVGPPDKTPPELSGVPADMTVEATGPEGATVAYAAATALDNADGDLPVVCTPASGTTFKLGTTPVTCSATDSSGNTNSKSFNVVVRDTTPPSITAPGTVTREATSAAGAVLNYTIYTHDLVDGWTARSQCVPASGTTFGFGTTTVSCTATDSHGNTSPPTTFKVVVVHNAGPVLTTPSTLLASAADASGAVVNYATSAYDAVDGPVGSSCSPASGSKFKLGITVVTCTASDNHGHTSTATFSILVRDTTPPTIHSTLTNAEATSRAGAVVAYSVAALDNVDGRVPATCTPASGSTFPIGTTKVVCSATDRAGNAGSSTFDVIVSHSAGPTLIVPATTIVEATGPAGAAVTYAVSAYDTVDGATTPKCSPASGQTFKLGNTTVTCTAIDNSGNVTTTAFNVVVRDTTPPTLTLPPAMVLGARGPQDAAPRYTVTASDAVDGALLPTCTPASGTQLRIGTTLVSCTTVDRAGNTAMGTFPVTVRATAPWLTDVSQSASRWRANGVGRHMRTRAPRGTAFSYTLSERAEVQFSFTQTLPGRRAGGRCVAPTRANRSRASCQRTVKVATLHVRGHAGKNTLRFRGRLSRKRWMAPGSYTLTIIAISGRHRSYPSTLRFRVIR